MPVSSYTVPVILSVDDRPLSHTLVRRALEPDYHIITVENGIEALARIYYEPVDLVLLDVSMPDVDGLEVCRIIRSIEQFRSLPIIMLTARDRPFDKIQGRVAGATEYLTKPFAAEQLRALVDNLIKRPPPTPPQEGHRGHNDHLRTVTMATPSDHSPAKDHSPRHHSDDHAMERVATFTLASPADMDLLLELLEEFYAIEELPFEPSVAQQTLQTLLQEPRYGLIHLIEVAGEVAGYVVLTFGFSLEFHGRDAWIDELYLRAAYRGQGIGKAALALMADICRREGIKALHLTVAHKNQRAQTVYRQAGYITHDRDVMTQWLS